MDAAMRKGVLCQVANSSSLPTGVTTEAVGCSCMAPSCRKALWIDENIYLKLMGNNLVKNLRVPQI